MLTRAAPAQRCLNTCEPHTTTFQQTQTLTVKPHAHAHISRFAQGTSIAPVDRCWGTQYATYLFDEKQEADTPIPPSLEPRIPGPLLLVCPAL